MSEQRLLPLRDMAQQGRFGAATAEAGVQFSIMHPVSLVQVLARQGGGNKLAEALAKLKSIMVMQAGPEQYFVQASGQPEGALLADLKKKLDGMASVVDQSHGRVVIVLAGVKSRAVLAKGTPVDFHADHFAIGQSAFTQMAHVGVHVTRSGADEFTLSVFRGFSESLWEWLYSQAAEFGYQVK